MGPVQGLNTSFSKVVSVIVISATFVAEPIEEPLRLVLDEAGLESKVKFAPYNQVFQQLLTPNSELARNSAEVSILLVRFEDFLRDQADPREALATLDRTSRELADALAHFSRQIKGALVFCLLPPGAPVAPEIAAAISRESAAVTEAARTLSGVTVLDPALIDALASEPGYDAERDNLAHVPYTDEYFAAMALAIGRRVHAVRVPAAKVLVLDCDNTLWKGVVGEDGVDGIEISAPFLAVQQFAIAQQAKGVLICLASKNSEADVLEVFERRSEMALKSSHVVAHRINWLPKPANIASLAAELNLGLDAFVFIDDNPVECGQMRAELPQVVTIQLPADSALIEPMLRNLWTFDKLVTTAEDANRTRMYRENTARRALESTVGDIGQFMAALELKIDIGAPDDDEWPRIEQLTQRTNQFNFTTRRQTLAQLKALQAEGATVLKVRVSDRFGDYGLVGAMVAHRDADALTVDNLMLSCRVLGRGVEHAMLRRLGDSAAQSALKYVNLPYIPTPRNEPARAFADSVVAEFAERGDAVTTYKIPVDRARAIEHRPGHDPAEVIEARLADEKKGSAKPAAPSACGDRSERYTELALSLNSGREVVRQLSAKARHARALEGAAAVPETPLEAQMLSVWESVLSMDGIGIDDDYFALGGTSLLSVALFAQIHKQFGVQMRLTSILDAPTVRSLTRLVENSAASTRQGLVCLRPGGQKNLFLVHDGLGETLLYLNLARRMPDGLAVYGIEPKRMPGIPLAHASIEDMAEYYVEQIRRIQPTGPYLLGGMCAGGVIAYGMAACLSHAGETVQIVTILDGAAPQAVKRTGLMAKARLNSFQETMAIKLEGRKSAFERWATIVAKLSRKASNVIRYEVSSRLDKVSIWMRFAMMRKVLASGGAWPQYLPELTVAQIYSQLEARYAPPALIDCPVLLVRASTGEAADKPFREVYRDEDFGWRSVARKLELVDVIGGHSSMLQEPYIDSLASALMLRLAGGFECPAKIKT